MTAPADIRAWAKTQGLEVGDRGRIAVEIQRRFRLAQGLEIQGGVETPGPARSEPQQFTAQRRGAVEPYVPHCPPCGKTWTGLSRAHCSACHETFNSVAGFDKHRVKGTCADPRKLKMVKRQGLWHLPGDRDWSTVFGRGNE